MSTPYEKQSFSVDGDITVAAGTLVTGDFCAIQCITEVTFTTLTDSAERGDSDYGTAATGTLTFTDAPAADETIAVNGTTYTFKTTAASATQISIGTGADAAAKAAATAANVATKVSANDVAVVVTSAAGVATITAAAKGTAGNSIALAESASNCTKSGTALSGGMSLTPAEDCTYPVGFLLTGKFSAIQPATGYVRVTLSSPLR